MKQLIIATILMCSFAACKKSTTESNEVKTVSTADTTTSVVIKTPEEMIDDYIKEYDAYFEEYKSAVKNDDPVKTTALGSKAKELYIKGEEAMRNASGEDYDRLKKYMDDKTNEIIALTAK